MGIPIVLVILKNEERDEMIRVNQGRLSRITRSLILRSPRPYNMPFGK